MNRTLLAAMALLASAPSFAQAHWYVDVAAPGPGAGTMLDPYPSIQQAVNDPNVLAGDIVHIAPGAYLESIDLGGKTLSLMGDPTSPPVVRGNGLDRLLTVTSGEGAGTSFFHLEFVGGSGGQSGSRGGAVHVESSTAAFVGCLFFANHICDQGGAVGISVSDVAFVKCVFESNRSGRAGGAISVQGGSLIVRDCLFDSNVSGSQQGCSGGNGRGGAIESDNARIECVDSVFLSNTASRGGAVYFDSSPGGENIARCHFEGNGAAPGALNNIRGGAVWARTFSFDDCVFLGNGAGVGGAVNEGTYRNCLFEGNTAGQGGAAASANLEDCVLRGNHAVDVNSNASAGGATIGCDHVRCLIVGNTCALGAGACHSARVIDRCTIIGNRGFPDFVAVEGTWLDNSIVWGNRAISAVGPVTQVDVGTITFSIVEDDPSTIAGPPLLFGPHVGDAHLLPGSPAIDAASGGLPLDPDGSPADIGAFTYDPAYRAAPSRFCDTKPTSAGCLPMISLVGLASLSGPPARVEVRDVPASTSGLLLLSADAQGVPFFGGTLCVGGSIVRAGIGGAVPATGCGDRLEFDLGQTELALVGSAPGDLLFVQVWFRDALHPDGSGVGISDAIVATVEN